MSSLCIMSIKKYLMNLQQELCQQFVQIDGKASFQEDYWIKDNECELAGEGLTCVLENGAVFEKAGINFSHVSGLTLPPSASSCRSQQTEKPFEALGVSLVVHPNNPYVPTSHFNIRFFMIKEKNINPNWWFGGGYDLTPYYGFNEDCHHWHLTAKEACDPFGEDIYFLLKKWCDDYFYLKHRQEPRGIGGLFFDNLNRWDFNRCFDFMQSVGNSYAKAYFPIVNKRKDMTFGEREKFFQRIRRGRYVEFNLLYDRGTAFGLQSGGRTESILMSLPADVGWQYNFTPELGTPESILLTDFLIEKDWIANTPV